ncbi:MAG: hypothetical protein Q9166_000195 [cf. Caloplaca sp. 2 TL-2023]
MPAYLCHICQTFNPFPSPHCQNCTHAYCIICLPLLPESSPLPPYFGSSTLNSSSSETAEGNSDVSSLTLDIEDENEKLREKEKELSDEDIIMEFMLIHPAYRLTRPSSPINPQTEAPPPPPPPRPHSATVSQSSTIQSDNATPLPLPLSTARTTEPRKPLPAPLPAPYQDTNDAEPLPLSSYALFAPIPLPAGQASKLLPPPPNKPQHRKHNSIPDIITNEGEHLRRTMSAQGEKVSRLMRKGSCRLKEVVRASSVSRVRGKVV